MVASQTLANFDGMMKQRYPSWKILQLMYTDRPFMALLPKDETFFGSAMKIPLWYGNSQNVSSTFSVANAGASQESVDAFLLTRKKNYGTFSIANEVIEASAKDPGAFMAALESNVEGALNAISNDINYQLWGTGTGKLSKIKAATSPGLTVTLNDPAESVYFEKGMYIYTSTADGGGSTKTACQITKVNRSTGVLTMAADVSGGGYSWAASDYIFRSGNYDQVISGVQAWVPYDDRTAKLAASFYGVTRNYDDYRLGGLIYDGSGTIEEQLTDALVLAGREGANVDHIFMNPYDMGSLIKALGSKVQYMQVSADIKEDGNVRAVVGFDGIQIYTTKGKAKVLADRGVPLGRAFALELNTWKLCSLNKLIRMFDADGLTTLRLSDDDGVSGRFVSYGNLSTNAPGKNMQIKLY